MELEDVLKAIDELTSRVDGHDKDIEGINASLKDFGSSLDELLKPKDEGGDDTDDDTDDEPDFGDAVDLDDDEKEDK